MAAFTLYSDQDPSNAARAPAERNRGNRFEGARRGQPGVEVLGGHDLGQLVEDRAPHRMLLDDGQGRGAVGPRGVGAGGRAAAAVAPSSSTRTSRAV